MIRRLQSDYVYATSHHGVGLPFTWDEFIDLTQRDRIGFLVEGNNLIERIERESEEAAKAQK